MTDEPAAVTLGRIDERLERIERYLFGNGQPGKLARLDERIEVCEQTDTRLYTVVGVLSFLAIVIGTWAAVVK